MRVGPTSSCSHFVTWRCAPGCARCPHTLLCTKRDTAVPERAPEKQDLGPHGAHIPRTEIDKHAEYAGPGWAGDDQVDGYDEHSLEGAIPRAAKAFVEADRAASAREQGYEVHVMKLLHRSACVRNDILVGWAVPGDRAGHVARRQ